MSQSANPEMLVLARESRGLTQSQLAVKTSISQGHISKFESGVLPVPQDRLRTVAAALDYPINFFFQPERIAGFGVSFVFHRKRANAPLGELKKIQARVNILTLHATRLLGNAEIQCENRFHRMDVQEYRGGPEEIAGLIRAVWNLAVGPVKNLVEAIENAGGIVFRYPFETNRIDALSQWLAPATPLFFLNEGLPGDRSRFTLAHEVAHTIMHRVPTPDLENEAHRFASEFLMPADEIGPDLESFTLEKATRLKPYWKVSIAALTKRAHDLGKISEHQYRRMFTQLTKLGCRKREPFPIPPEEPSLINDLLTLYREHYGYSIADLCKLLALHEHEFQAQYMSQTIKFRPAR